MEMSSSNCIAIVTHCTK